MAAVTHQCDNCKQNFKTKQHLARHMLHCVKNVVFTRDSYQKAFERRDNLRHAQICAKKE